jgi:flagellar M-ring protein FliF
MRNLGPVRLAVIGGIGVALVAFVIYLAMRLGGPEMSLLYADLPSSEVNKITQRLEAMNVPYKLKGDQIQVPGDQVARVRVTLASEGLPSGGSIGYEIFDKSQGLATSSFVQNVNQLRALEGELARTIASIDNVKGARVHLVLPQRELFTRDKQDPSASIMLRMGSGRRLDRNQTVAVQNIVAAAVPGLKPERISIADERGTLLARGSDSGAFALASAEEMRVGYEDRVARAVEQLLERNLGPNRARAQVAAEIDYDRTNKNEESFDPDRQVVRSTQNVNELAEQSESDGNPSVTVANNLPTGQAQGGTASVNNSKNSRSEETVNYEISRVVKNTVREPGGVKAVKVAVMVDGVRGVDAAGKPTYRDRTKAEIDKLKTLVEYSVGGENTQVVVESLQFVTEEDDASKSGARLFGLDRAELIKLAEILVLGAVGALVLLLVVRPLMARLFEAAPSAAPAGMAGAAMLGGPGGIPQLAGPGGSSLDIGSAMEMGDDLEEMIDLNRIEGRVKASSLRKIGEIVEKHPEDVVAILRNWLYQES